MFCINFHNSFQTKPQKLKISIFKKDVCTSKQEVVGSNPARVACEVFFTDTRKAQCNIHVGVRQN